MMLTEEQKKEIEDFFPKITCSKDFVCYRSNFEKLCKARDMGLKDFVDCLDEGSRVCGFSTAFGDGFFCGCPLRVYIAKKLRR